MSEVAEKIRKIFGIYISEKANEYTLNGLQNLKKEVLDAVESMEQQITDLENRLEAQNAVMFDVAKKRKKLEQRLSEIRKRHESFFDWLLEREKSLDKTSSWEAKDNVRMIADNFKKELLDGGEQSC